MSWKNRIIQAIYTSPSGEEFVGQFEDVSKTISKKTTPFDFPDVDGTFVQDLGKKGRRYPLRWVFWGENYDAEAERFDNALEEKGAGQLQHPFYPGVFDVVPVGDITRVDALKTAGNQAVYNITFWETIEIVFPVSELSAKNAINIKIDDFAGVITSDGTVSSVGAAPEYFDDSLSVVSSTETVNFVDAAKAALRKVKAAMAKIAATSADIQRQFTDAFDLIDNAIDTLVGAPTLLAAQLIEFTRLPSQAAASIGAKLDSYTTLISSFTGGPSNQFEPSSLDSVPGNNFAINDLLASSSVISMIESTVSDEANFSTRTGTIEAIESMQAAFDQYVAWSDTNRDALVAGGSANRKPGTNDLIDTGESYQSLQDALAIASGRLTEIVFTALQERSVTLDRNRSLLDFAGEFYGEIDTKIDFIIESNKLTGSEILELPKGRKMLYYV